MRGYSYLEMTAISWKTATFVLPCLIVCCLWNPQGPVTQHSFCFITRTKAWLTLFEIVCFRYNESNYSGLRWEQRGSRQHVSNIIGNDGILQQTGKKSNSGIIFFFFFMVHQFITPPSRRCCIFMGRGCWWCSTVFQGVPNKNDVIYFCYNSIRK